VIATPAVIQVGAFMRIVLLVGALVWLVSIGVVSFLLAIAKEDPQQDEAEQERPFHVIRGGRR
jgi:hypothetical protein